MGFTNRERTDALALYLGLGLEVFPYDTRAVAFIGWNNPALYGDHYRDLAGRTHTFGVRLDEWTAVVDVDADDGGDLERLELDVGPLPPTFTVVSPGGEGNLHLMFRTSVPLRTCRALKAFHPGIDFLSAGSHVKGASSVRYLETNEEVMYKFQRPILDPAPLPAALEARWAKMMPATDDDLFREQVAEGLAGSTPQKLTHKESRNVASKIAKALDKIGQLPDGGRHEPLFNACRDIYRRAVLLGRSIDFYDGQIKGAYAESGGTDFDGLARNMRSVKVWAAQHPLPRPGISAYHRLQNDRIAEWADAAAAANNPKDKKLRALILAVASVATTELNMTTAATSIAAKYPEAGERETVSANLDALERQGWLMPNGEGITSLGWAVPHRKLEKPRS